MDKFSRSGVYQLTCQDCGKKYNGQTGSTFRNRYNEVLNDRIYKSNTTNFIT